MINRLSKAMSRRLSFLIGALCAAPAVAQTSTGNVAEALATITEQDMLTRIGVLADDSMAGRNTLSPEIRTVAHWIASEFQRAGLQPGGDDGGFIQQYSIVRTQFDVVESTGELSGAKDVKLTMGRDFLLVPTPQSPRLGTVTGDFLVVQAPTDSSLRIPDDVDLSGKIVVHYTRRLQQNNVRLPYNRRWTDRGAVGVLWVVRVPDDRFGLLIQNLNRSRTHADLEGRSAPLFFVRASTVEEAFTAAGTDLRALADEASNTKTTLIRSVEGLTGRFHLARRVFRRYEAPNVVGILPGSDPDLKAEYLVYSAHMDHVGVAGRGRCPPVDDDRICNGADDDASGTAGVLELAEAFAALKTAPKRSIVFLAVSGEEYGLWGSRYYTEKPSAPIPQTVADLNIDMIGRNWKDTIAVIGQEQSDLGETLARVNAAHPELGMDVIGDIWPEEQFYYRSDHFNFARSGVPILFFFNGTHEDYHRPTDELSKIDGEKAARIVKLLFYLGLEVANADERPQWKPGAYQAVVEGEGLQGGQTPQRQGQRRRRR